MTDNRGNGKLGLILGVLIAIAAVAFLLNGGENLGKKSVKSDARPAAGHIRTALATSTAVAAAPSRKSTRQQPPGCRTRLPAVAFLPIETRGPPRRILAVACEIRA